MDGIMGRVTAIRRYDGGGREPEEMLYIACPPEAAPGPGAYSLATPDAEEPSRRLSVEALAVPLFRAHVFEAPAPGSLGGARTPDGFWALPADWVNWPPGTVLRLHGPLGRGFRLPASAGPTASTHLAVAAVSGGFGRLLPLVAEALAVGWEVALYGAASLPANLPAAVEVHPPDALKAAQGWAGALALDLAVGELTGLRTLLGLVPEAELPCPGQALVRIPMPCGGGGSCSVCAVRGRRGWALACRDGPVFGLDDLNW